MVILKKKKKEENKKGNLRTHIFFSALLRKIESFLVR